MILSKRLNIRPIQRRDLDAIVPIHSDPLVNKYLPYQTWESRADAEAWFDRAETLSINKVAEQFVVELRATGDLIGTCIVMNHDVPPQAAKLGYVLNRQYWGQGYMFEAMTAFIDYLHQQLKINTVQAIVEVGNTASIRLLDKLDFIQDKPTAQLTEENLLSFSRRTCLD